MNARFQSPCESAVSEPPSQNSISSSDRSNRRREKEASAQSKARNYKDKYKNKHKKRDTDNDGIRESSSHRLEDQRKPRKHFTSDSSSHSCDRALTAGRAACPSRKRRSSPSASKQPQRLPENDASATILRPAEPGVADRSTREEFSGGGCAQAEAKEDAEGIAPHPPLGVAPAVNRGSAAEEPQPFARRSGLDLLSDGLPANASPGLQNGLSFVGSVSAAPQALAHQDGSAPLTPSSAFDPFAPPPPSGSSDSHPIEFDPFAPAVNRGPPTSTSRVQPQAVAACATQVAPAGIAGNGAALLQARGVDMALETALHLATPQVQQQTCTEGILPPGFRASSTEVAARLRCADAQLPFPPPPRALPWGVGPQGTSPGLNVGAYCAQCGVDMNAEQALRSLPEEAQRAVMSEGLCVGMNPSALLMARVRKARDNAPPGCGVSAGGQLLNFPPPPDYGGQVITPPQMHIGCSGPPPPNGSGELRDHVERFLTQNCVDVSAGQALRSAPPEVQRQVLTDKPLQGCHNPSAVLMANIRRAMSADIQGNGSDAIAHWAQQNNLDRNAEASLRSLPPDFQSKVMEMGPVLGTNPSAILMGRIRLVRSNPNGMPAQPYQSGHGAISLTRTP